jgi:hypothetical protein
MAKNGGKKSGNGTAAHSPRYKRQMAAQSATTPAAGPSIEMPTLSMEAPQAEEATSASTSPQPASDAPSPTPAPAKRAMPRLTMTSPPVGGATGMPGTLTRTADGIAAAPMGRPQRIRHQQGRGSGVVLARAIPPEGERVAPAEVPPAGAAGADAGPTTTTSDGGGAILTNVHIQLIFWGAAWTNNPTPSVNDITNAVQSILNGPYMSALSQYRGIGGGLLRGTSVFTDTNPPNPFSNANVTSFITSHIEDGSLPEPDDDNQILYCVVMPSGVISNQANVIGEHTFFTYTDYDFPFDFDNDNAHYAWLTGGSLDTLSVVFSHELAESVTDPEGDAIQIDPRNGSSWNEIGDVCQSTGRTNGVLVQSYWSQRDRACIIPTGLPRWTSLGGVINGGLSALRNADGRLEVFSRGQDGALWHIWQTARNNGWSNWASLGGFITGRNSAVRNADGRLEVFARGADAALWHIWQTARNNGWSDWASLGGGIDDLFVATGNADGRLEVFARGGDGALWHCWQTAPNNGWSGWSSLGGQIQAPLAVGTNRDGRLEVFARGQDGGLWHIWQTAPNDGWSGWASLGGQIGNLLDVGSNADGRLEACARGLDGALWHIWQTAPNNGWSGWASFGGQVNDVLAMGRNADGRLEVFARGGDNALWHNWQVAPNNGWSGWDTMGGQIADLTAVSNNADGRLEVFVRGFDFGLWHVWQTAPSNGWNV